MSYNPGRSRIATSDHAVHELTLFAENESSLYSQRQSIQKNLLRKLRKGIYDRSLAWKLWKYWFDRAAKEYVAQFGSPGAKIFSVGDREQAAKNFAIQEESALRSGEYDYLLPKKNPSHGSMTKKYGAVPGYDGKFITVGDRVELHPATDLWMRGARFGKIRAFADSGNFRVKLDHVKKLVNVEPRNLRIIDEYPVSPEMRKAHDTLRNNPSRPPKGTPAYVNRRSEATKKKPTKRLKKRRTRNRRERVFPNPGRLGFGLYARKGSGPRMHFDGNKFSTNGEAKVFDSASLAQHEGEHLLLRYPILKSYRVTVEPTRGK